MGKIVRRRPSHRHKRSKPWQIQEAKSKFSQLIDIVQEEGVQKITKNGEEVAFIVSKDFFEKMQPGEDDLLAFFKKAPFPELDLKIIRSQESAREFDL